MLAWWTSGLPFFGRHEGSEIAAFALLLLVIGEGACPNTLRTPAVTPCQSLLHDLLRVTIQLCRMQQPHEGAILCSIAGWFIVSWKRGTPSGTLA
jgi:hypothetical protein